ncbi:MAG: Ger(x)C family spore germination C-terminal domain-containing protein [Syntrophomonadaceae bacterium]
MPDLWKSIYHDWDSLFADLKVNVTSTIDIRNTGLISKPIKVGE